MKTCVKTCQTLRVFLLGALLWVGFSGCATKEIWSTPALDNFHEPASPSQLAVYHAPEKNDFLVEYDDLSPSKDRPVRRAYFLNENALATSQGKKPRFAQFKAAEKGTPLPVVGATNLVVNHALLSTTYVILKNHQRFGIYHKGQELVGEYDLPTYATSAGTIKRVMLTPITITLDATVVGGWLFRELAPALIGSAHLIR